MGAFEIITAKRIVAWSSIVWVVSGLMACGGDACPAGKVELGGRCVTSPKEDIDDAMKGDGSMPSATGGMEASGGRGGKGSGGDAAGSGGMDGSGGDVVGTGGDVDGTGDTMMDEDGGLPDAMMVDLCEVTDCNEHSACVVEDDMPSCLCDEGYVQGDSGCERDECTPLPGAEPACGENTTCKDLSADEGDVTCACEDGYADCDSSPNSCEVELANDRNHCGACGNVCAGDLSCLDGVCEQAADRIEVGLMATCYLSNRDASGVYDLRCTGDNRANLFGPGTSGGKTSPTTIAAFPRVRDIALGDRHTCVIPPQGDEVTCWGLNGNGQLADSDTQNHDVNTPVTTRLTGVVDVAAGGSHTCALTGAGVVYCWGQGSLGRLGYSANTLSVPRPSQVPGITNAVELDVFGPAACVRKRNNQVVCWGQTGYNMELLPTTIMASSGEPLLAKSVDVGGTQSTVTYAAFCAHTVADGVECWGYAGLGLVNGVTSTTADYKKGTDLGLSEVVDVSLGSAQGCAVDASGRVFCWGSQDLLPPDSTSILIAPSRISLPGQNDRAIDVEVGAYHMCVRLDDGQALCQGNNLSGQLGNRTATGDLTVVPWVQVIGYP